jgi:hypothetical protein
MLSKKNTVFCNRIGDAADQDLMSKKNGSTGPGLLRFASVRSSLFMGFILNFRKGTETKE